MRTGGFSSCLDGIGGLPPSSFESEEKKNNLSGIIFTLFGKGTIY